MSIRDSLKEPMPTTNPCQPPTCVRPQQAAVVEELSPVLNPEVFCVVLGPVDFVDGLSTVKAARGAITWSGAQNLPEFSLVGRGAMC